MSAQRRIHPVLRLVVIAFMGLSCTHAIGAGKDPICKRLQGLLMTSPFLYGHELEQLTDDRGKRRIPNVDVDGDGRIDEVYWECSQGGSPIPTDPCDISIKFFAGDHITFSEFSVAPVLFTGRLYAVKATVGPKRKAGGGQVWRFDKSGAILVCTDL